VAVVHRDRLSATVRSAGGQVWRSADFEDSLRLHIQRWEVAGTVAVDDPEDDEASE
jgi:hypothetical protein